MGFPARPSFTAPKRLDRSEKSTGESKSKSKSKSESRQVEVDTYYEIKTKIHDRLIDLIDLSLLDTLEEDALKGEIGKLVERLLREEFAQMPLNQFERDKLVAEIQDEMLGLGPLEPFLKDPSVSDIMVNSYRQIWVERKGKLQLTDSRFKDNTHLKKIIDRIVSRVGRRVDESSPMVDARLADGSRVNAIISPLAIDGPALSIRKFSRDPLEIPDLVNYKALTQEIAEVLRGCVQCRLNILISGGTGSGKTTMLNCLSRFIPSDERIVTVEDAAELQLKQEHVVRLETRPPNIEGKGEITQRDLVKNCLRMRPDRVIIGEVRGGEALDMLQAMNTGHDGSLATIHANTPRDALMRLETMVAMTGLNISSESLKRYVSSAIDVIIQIARLSDGSRKLISFQEITGMEGEIITMQEIFAFEQHGLSAENKVKGVFVSRGIRPKFYSKFISKGVTVPDDVFNPGVIMEV
ncbi:CpaF family protein [Desulfovibrio inopinatus]|uniref:CpaF family protein n=1 Tax=Desulfovibrio inopinatus TaxID=102109 RepID=UPI00042649AF|nr:CpaF family protein [Desulfovibrio inopinatus]